MSELRAQAQAWRDADPDPETRAELDALLDALLDDGDDGPLAERFGARLEFGTAGIRGPLGAGPARMNRVVVRRVTAGLAAHLKAADPDVGERGVVVGHDARHCSAEFAADAAGVLAAAGIPVTLVDALCPTPVLAFAVRHLGTSAGVQITASHNPATDNGYKVFWSGGAQIIPPLDAAISAAIDAVDGPVPVADPRSALIARAGEELVEAYRDAVVATIEPDGPRDLTIAYTPLHGVGGDLAEDILVHAGFPGPAVVWEQADPDPDFPTVAFPNPEVPGALDLVTALADDVEADLVLAHDPDADRIAVAVPDPDGDGWRALSGDETGCVLAEDLLRRSDPEPGRVVATTVVSSQLLRRIAADHGAGYVETLTGFKWLAASTAEAESDGRRMVLAYEQALGVMVGTLVRDKDGLSAGLAVADLAARLKAEGRTLLDAVDDLARRHGLHLTRGRNVLLDQAPSLVEAVLERLRGTAPTDVDGVAVVAIDDHVAGTRTRPDGARESLRTPPTPLYGLELEDGSRLQVRPSGTEPLLKFYAEVVEPVTQTVAAARRRAEGRIERLTGAFLALAGLG